MLRLVPIELNEANKFVKYYHRHHKQCVGHRFSIGAIDGTKRLVGVAIVGRPVARTIDQSKVVEVARLCTDGTKNACSFLYSAAARIAKELGYETIQTYILTSEPGTSLRASGWKCDGQYGQSKSDSQGWNNREGRRTDQPIGPKLRWRKILRESIDRDIFDKDVFMKRKRTLWD